MLKIFSSYRNVIKFICILFIINTFNGKVFSQDTIYSWKKIPEDDLKMEIYEQDPTADAVVLQQYVEIKFDIWRDEFRLFYEVNRRIKILTEEGLKYASIEIPYIGLEDYEEAISVSGFTYNYKNNAVKIKKLKIKDIEKIESDKVIYYKKFEMPDVEIGSVIEYKYTIASLNFIEPETFYFQEKIPVRYSEFRAVIPDFITYKINVKGFDNLDFSEYSETVTNLNWIFKNEDPIPSGLNYHSRDFSVNMHLKFDSHFYSYTMKNIPAFQSEDLIDSYLNYIYSVSLNLQQVTQNIGYYSYIEQLAWESISKRMYQTTNDNYYIMSKQKSDFKTYPSGYILYNTKTWDEFSTQILNTELFGLHLVKAWKSKQIIEKIYNSDSSDIYNVTSIYNFVRDSINWDNNYNIFISKTLEEVYNSGTGSGSEINMLLIQLLRKAEFEANPVLIKTRSDGKPDLELPSINQFNHVIAAVELNGQIILLDAIDKKRPYYLLNFEDFNQFGFLLKKVESKWIEINNYSESKVVYTDSISFTNDKVKIKKQIEDFGYYAYNKRTNPINQQNLFNYFNNTIYPDIEILNYDDYEKSLITKYTVENEKIIDEDKNSITLYPFKYSSNFENPLESIFRNYPVNFGYDFSEEYNVIIEIPDGYNLITVSEFHDLILGNNEAALELKSEIVDSTNIQINISLKINKAEYPVSQYYLLRDLFEEYSKLSEFFIYFEKN